MRCLDPTPATRTQHTATGGQIFVPGKGLADRAERPRFERRIGVIPRTAAESHPYRLKKGNFPENYWGRQADARPEAKRR